MDSQDTRSPFHDHGSPADIHLAVTVRGVVQGVGFRPFVFNAARAAELAGWVRNEVDRVRIEVQGAAEAVERFLETLRQDPPPAARIESVDVERLPVDDRLRGAGFRIDQSGDTAAPRPTIPADLATCADCLREIHTPGERRHRYPFTNCTACGPRWSIIRSLPYDRPRTSMADFPMCGACRREYEDPTDRRFHAQPIACPICGPTLTLLDPRGETLADADDAMRRAVDAVRAGRIVALKGLGGFQLLCDATDEQAVARLRQRKRRPDRPLAVMAPTLDDARAWCEVSDEEAAVLESVEAPIVLLRRSETRGASPAAKCPGCVPSITDAVAPGNPYLGVMLPYTPLHHILMRELARPIVCTSGNLSDEPMAIDTTDAIDRLGPIADVILTHDRPIVRPVDDSVVRVDAEGLRVLRRARGYAPRAFPLPAGDVAGGILAVGGHLKNTVGLALLGDSPQAIIGAHIGDLDSVASVEVHRRAIDDLLSFFRVTPTLITCDLHPDYASTREAERLAAGPIALPSPTGRGAGGEGYTGKMPVARGWKGPHPNPLPKGEGTALLRVQHHHAHVAAVMAEHRLDGPVLGVAWDGTGYGTDGTVWGGEFLRSERDEFERVAHLRTFPLPGGDRAAREPRRSALGLLWAHFGGDRQRIEPLLGDWFEPAELDLLSGALQRGVNCPTTSSMGRLFDAVAALVGLPPVISFEGQAAMALEFAADPEESQAYEIPIVEHSQDASGTPNIQHPTSPLTADWAPMLDAILADRAAGVPRGRIAARFHHSLADLAVAAASRAGLPDVALTGGCFQNAVLSDLTRRRLVETGHRVYTPRETPPGDGGVALGQLFVALHHLRRHPPSDTNHTTDQTS